jgi:hypothetical protein
MVRKYIPVYTRCGADVCITKDGAYAKDKQGSIKWVYKGAQVTGKGIYVCAAARSATVYISKVLRELGYDIGHEIVGTDGSVGYHLAVIKPDNCFHQVRHPLKQISSMMVHKAWGFIERVIDVNIFTLKGCMEYWLKWNLLCEDFCVWRYQIEQFPDVWEDFLKRIDHKYEPLPDVPKDTNSSRKGNHLEKTNYKKFTWDDLFECDRQLAQAIYDKHIEYGYVPERIKQDQPQITLTA